MLAFVCNKIGVKNFIAIKGRFNLNIVITEAKCLFRSIILSYMHNFIVRNWLILAIASLLVAIYITIFDGFVNGKAYMFFALATLFGVVYYLRQKKASK